MRAVGGLGEDELLRLAASLERASEHPLAAAVVRAAADRNLVLGKVEDFDSPAGKGVTGTVDGRKVALGNRAMMQAAGIDVAPLEGPADELRNDGATAIFAAIDGKACGVIAIADPIKPTTAGAVRVAEAKRASGW